MGVTKTLMWVGSNSPKGSFAIKSVYELRDIFTASLINCSNNNSNYFGHFLLSSVMFPPPSKKLHSFRCLITLRAIYCLTVR
jgi:hypothetical protein